MSPKGQKRKTPNKNEQDSPAPKNLKVEPSLTPGKTPKNKKNSPAAKPAPPALEKFKGTSEISVEQKQQNRHQARRKATKERRQQVRAKFNETKQKAINGDAAARSEIEAKVAAIEADGPVSKNKKRKLAVLKRILNNDGSQNANQKPGPKVTAQVVKKNVPKKQQNGKPKAPPPVLEADSDDDDDEEEEDDAEVSAQDEEASDDDVSDEVEGDDDVSDDGEEEEEGIDEEEEDDEEDSDVEDSDAEEELKVTSKKPAVVPQKPKPGPAVNQGKKPGNQQAQQSPQSKKSRFVLFVGNIAYTSTENDLREHFKKAGEIADIRIPKQGDKPRGFAYVELKDDASYQKALSLHNSFLGGRKINVLHSESGKKNSDQKKANLKATNFKFNAARKQGKPGGGFKGNQKWGGRGRNQK